MKKRLNETYNVSKRKCAKGHHSVPRRLSSHTAMLPGCGRVTVRAETSSNPGTTVNRSKEIKGQHCRSYLLPVSDRDALPGFFSAENFQKHYKLKLTWHGEACNWCSLKWVLFSLFCFSRDDSAAAEKSLRIHGFLKHRSHQILTDAFNIKVVSKFPVIWNNFICCFKLCTFENVI